MELYPGIHHFETGPFNWYVVEEDGRLTLIDAGFPGHYSIFRDGLDQMGRSPKDVEAIILTHAHADHTGFANRLQLETGAPIMLHHDELPGFVRPLNLPWYGLLTRSWKSHIRLMLLHATLQGVFRSPSKSKTFPFRDGDRLKVPGRPEVIHIPGHTPGEVAFYLPRQQVLVSGDTLVTLDLMSGRDGGPQLPHKLLNDNDVLARKSLDRMRELGRVKILPGHGEPWEGEMKEAIESALRVDSKY